MELGLFIAFIIVCCIFFFIYKRSVDKRSRLLKEERLEAEISALEEPTIEMTPEKFFEIRKNLLKEKRNLPYINGFNFAGIYILHNLTKDKHYVGQSVNVMKRVNMHFGGKRSGNKDVYKDFIQGDKWNIKLLRLEDSNYYNLNDLEKYAIKLYKGFDKGYNKTRGNKS